MAEHTPRPREANDEGFVQEMREALEDLVEQIEQARDGMGIYANSPSMSEALATANALIRRTKEPTHA